MTSKASDSYIESHPDYCGTGWACMDCVILFANGDMPADLTEEECDAYQARIDKTMDGCTLTIGWLSEEHDESCPRFAGDTDTECDCETNTFSMSSCDVCGGNLGGERRGVSFWRDAYACGGCAQTFPNSKVRDSHEVTCDAPLLRAQNAATDPALSGLPPEVLTAITLAQSAA